MLTPELIKANEALASLSDDQITALTTLSANDETAVIASKIGEHHGRVEADVLQISGLQKNSGEKSFDYLKRVMSGYKDQSAAAAPLQSKIAAAEQTIASLEAKIAEGKGSEVFTQKLADAEAKLSALQNQYDGDKNAWETEKTGYTEKISGIKVGAEFGKAISGLKFKAEYPASVQKTLIDAAKAGILSGATPDWTEQNGVKTMIFRDKDGAVMLNKSNGLAPFTAEELLTDSLKDILDLQKKATGGGTGPAGDKSKAAEAVDISAAKSQIEGDNLIRKHLLQKGYLAGSAEFAEEQKKIRNDNKIGDLPMR